MKKKFKFNNGYTLIELVIVMLLLIITGALVVGIISSTLRGSSKTRLTSDLAQNGNFALTLISNILINSQKMVSFTKDGGVEVSDCTESTSTGVPLSGQGVTVLGFDGGTTKLFCNGPTISSSSAIFANSTPLPTPYATASLLDNSQVEVTSCSFTCSQINTYSPPRIDISFQLDKAQVGNVAAPSVKFNTSITLRNHNLR